MAKKKSEIIKYTRKITRKLDYEVEFLEIQQGYYKPVCNHTIVQNKKENGK